jgi:hypothetical protein
MRTFGGLDNSSDRAGQVLDLLCIEDGVFAANGQAPGRTGEGLRRIGVVDKNPRIESIVVLESGQQLHTSTAVTATTTTKGGEYRWGFNASQANLM